MVSQSQKTALATARLAIRAGLDGDPRSGRMGRGSRLGRGGGCRWAQDDHGPLRGQLCLPFALVAVVLHAAPAGLGYGRGGVPLGVGARAVHWAYALFGFGELVDRPLSRVGQLCSDPEPDDRAVERSVRGEIRGRGLFTVEKGIGNGRR